LEYTSSATTFLGVKTVSDKVVRHSLWPNYPCKNDRWRRPLSTWNFGSN